MSAAEASILTLFYAVLGALAVYSLHRFHLVRLRRRSPEPERRKAADFPHLAIQLPLYNEPNVAGRLLDAVAAIEYPGPLEIQVLDDSTDETTRIVDARVREMRKRGLEVAHIRRPSREGFKAGALAHGLTLTPARLLAVFDADFVPPPGLLREMVPYFADQAVGMVQARWTHLNREQSLLTRVQALFLDAHFAVESAARNFGRRFFNFNGTAGIWRREAIEEAGGWSASTLTEDLDLSYRAQLAGWQFVFLPDVAVPAELPAAIGGFQDQQHRWAKGSVQTARKVLGDVLRSDWPRFVKSEAVFHLTNNVAYLFTFLLALLIVPAMLIRYRHGLLWTFFIDLGLFAISTSSVLLFYREGQRFAGVAAPSLRVLLAALPVGVGMSVRNASAVLEGLVQSGGYFKRTPKRGSDPQGSAVGSRGRFPFVELALAAFFATVVVAFAAAGRWVSLPFLLLFVSGFGYVAAFALIERLSSNSRAS